VASNEGLPAPYRLNASYEIAVQSEARDTQITPVGKAVGGAVVLGGLTLFAVPMIIFAAAHPSK
jgi:hypothetical protein